MSLSQVIEQARQGDSTAREHISELLRDRVMRTAGHYANLTGMDREEAVAPRPAPDPEGS